VRLKLDLHNVYNRAEDIDRRYAAVIAEAVGRGGALVEIMPGKGRVRSRNECSLSRLKEVKTLSARSSILPNK
jgi:hypothetical protein